MNSIILTIGGVYTVDNILIQDALGEPNIFLLETRNTNSGEFGLTENGIVTLTSALKLLNTRIQSQPDLSQLNYAIFNLNRILEDINSVRIPTFDQPYTIRTRNLKITTIVLGFSYKAIVRGLLGLKIEKRNANMLPVYMGMETSGVAYLSLEFNIPTKFDNTNFRRAENDNFTEKIQEFIVSPQFNLALHLRPQTNKNRKTTIAPALQSMVTYIYSICVKIQRQQISFDEGKILLDRNISIFDPYWDRGMSMYSLEMINGNLVLFFCKRYHLKRKDCLVAFNLMGTDDFINDRPEPEYKQVLMNVSSVPLDEDMSDAIYPQNTGVFVYQRTE